MKKIYDNVPEPDYAILVGVGINKIIDESSLDELSALAATCNVREVGRVVQNRKEIDTTFYIGKGKVDEIARLIEEKKANVVIFDIELSGSKTRNLEKELGVTVLDRSKVILDIFALRAQSMEGKLQVELAQLKYNSTRLVVGQSGYMSQMKSAVGMRGPGEKKLELDKRTIKNQITELEQKLRKLSANRNLNRKSANKSGKKRVCLVGYTNSGKSTLLNTISKAGVLAEDKLFATLDPKTTNVYIEGTHILLTDTVGFIDKLPHEFIKAFESTLDEARYADLLLHMVDVANPNYHAQVQVVEEVLAKIGASAVPTILVLNKIDMLSQTEIAGLDKQFEGRDHMAVSAKNNKGIDGLKELIRTILSKNFHLPSRPSL